MVVPDELPPLEDICVRLRLGHLPLEPPALLGGGLLPLVVLGVLRLVLRHFDLVIALASLQYVVGYLALVTAFETYTVLRYLRDVLGFL